MALRTTGASSVLTWQRLAVNNVSTCACLAAITVSWLSITAAAEQRALSWSALLFAGAPCRSVSTALPAMNRHRQAYLQCGAAFIFEKNSMIVTLCFVFLCLCNRHRVARSKLNIQVEVHWQNNFKRSSESNFNTEVTVTATVTVARPA